MALIGFVVEALGFMKDEKGSTVKQVSEYVQEKASLIRDTAYVRVQKALNKAVEEGLVVRYARRYMLTGFGDLIQDCASKLSPRRGRCEATKVRRRCKRRSSKKQRKCGLAGSVKSGTRRRSTRGVVLSRSRSRSGSGRRCRSRSPVITRGRRSRRTGRRPGSKKENKCYLASRVKSGRRKESKRRRSSRSSSSCGSSRSISSSRSTSRSDSGERRQTRSPAPKRARRMVRSGKRFGGVKKHNKRGVERKTKEKECKVVLSGRAKEKKEQKESTLVTNEKFQNREDENKSNVNKEENAESMNSQMEANEEVNRSESDAQNSPAEGSTDTQQSGGTQVVGTASQGSVQSEI